MKSKNLLNINLSKLYDIIIHSYQNKICKLGQSINYYLNRIASSQGRMKTNNKIHSYYLPPFFWYKYPKKCATRF